MQDREYMEFAIELAKAAKGRTNPNPKVGSVIVKEHRIVGFGAHLRAGTPHAEVHAVRMAGEEARGSTVYITLEPCSHFGRTPPCADLLINAGVARVVVAMEDPNPLVAGKGLQKLKAAGIDVVVGVCEQRAKEMNEVFLKTIQTDLPFIAVKAAASMDGKTATANGDSKWITGPEAREYVHRLRDEYDAIMVGVGTVLQDNPQLTVRLPEGGIHPHRIIVDPYLRSAEKQKDAYYVLDTKLAPTTFMCTSEAADSDRAKRLRSIGCGIIGISHSIIGEGQVRLDLAEGLRELKHAYSISSVLVEGGATLNGALFDEGLIDKFYLFLAPKLIGGIHSSGIFGGIGVSTISNAWILTNMNIQRFGEDLCLTGSFAR